MLTPNDHILLKDALDLMRRKDANGFPIPFTIRYVTLNRQLKTGGKLREVKAILPHVGLSKAQKHYRNAIRNIRTLPDNQLIPVHIYLITRINNLWIL